MPIYAVRIRNITKVNKGRIESQKEPTEDGKKNISYVEDENGNIFETENRLDSKQQLIYSKDYRGIVQENTYDSYGNITESITYPHKEGKYSVNRIITKSSYSSSGNFLSTEIDPRYKDNSDCSEIKTRYSYSNTTGLMSYMTLPNNQVINYSYDSYNGNVTGVSSYLDGNTNSNSYSYTKDYLTATRHNNFSYNFDYDGFGNIISAKAAGQNLISKTFNYTSSNDTEIIEYSNGEIVKNVYDKYGRVVEVYLNNVLKVQNTYSDENNENNSSAKFRQHIDSNSGMTYNYLYDIDESVKGISFSGEHSGSIICSKDSANDRLESINYSLDGESYSYLFDFEKNPANVIYPDNKLNKIVLKDGLGNQIIASQLEYDSLARNKNKLIASGSLNITNSYNYLNSGYCDYCNNLITDRTTPYISNFNQTVNGNPDTTAFTYDKCGNIKSISSAKGSIYYTYDALNRLTQEDNRILNKRFSYTYNAGGNITNKTVYDISNGTSVSYPYAYANAWKDQLTSYNGQGISYDNMGNPISYMGASLTWTCGKSLSSYTKNGKTYNYFYNADGIRTKKTVNGTTYKYLLEGNKVLREDRTKLSGTDTILYYYDFDGIVGFGLKNQGESAFTNFVYAKNLQGDITAVYDVNGNKKAEYLYDAWGNQTVLVNIDNIAEINPHRYRSYYFDTETSLYYLNSRYYDSNIGRFISSDQNICSGNHINSFNQYNYCWDNPIIYIDNTGFEPEVNVGFKIFEIPIWGKSGEVWKSRRTPIKAFSTKNLWNFKSILENVPPMFTNIFTAKALSYDLNLNISISDSGVSIVQAEIFAFETCAYLNGINNNDDYLYIHLLKAELNLGANDEVFGFDGGIYVGEIGVKTKYVDASIKYGVGATLDFSEGIRFGASLGIGFEINIKLW